MTIREGIEYINSTNTGVTKDMMQLLFKDLALLSILSEEKATLACESIHIIEFITFFFQDLGSCHNPQHNRYNSKYRLMSFSDLDREHIPRANTAGFAVHKRSISANFKRQKNS